MELSKLDRKIMKRVQRNFPICQEPFKKISEDIGVEKDVLISKLRDFQEKGLIRNISPKISSSKVGYDASTLVAVKTEDERTEEVAEFINRYKGVTHNYERTANYNIWFTLHAESEERLKQVVSEIEEETEPMDIISLPKERMYKLHLDLNLEDVKNG